MGTFSSKAISYIISSIIMLMIVMALGGVTYMFITGTFTRSTAQTFTIIDSYNDTITISNSGSEPISSITARIDGQAAAVAVMPTIGGLVGYWSFNEGAGTTVTDSSGNRNHGTLNGATWTNGKYEKALSFDGINDNVEILNTISLNPTDKISISLWVDVTEFGDPVAGPDRVLSKGQNEAYQIWIDNSGRVSFVIGLTWNVGPAFTPLSTGTWYHIVGTYDGNNAKLYVNGDLKSTYTYGVSIPTTSDSLILGDWAITPQRMYKGILDEVHIYNRALAPGEITQLYSGLVAAGQSGTVKILTPLTRGNHNIRICSPSMCTRGSLTII